VAAGLGVGAGGPERKGDKLTLKKTVHKVIWESLELL